MKTAVLPIVAALSLVSPPAAAYDVVVLQSFENPVYAKAIEGYSETCGGKVKTYTLGKDKKIAAADLDAIKKSKPAAILAVGQSALTEILDKKPPVPVIFTAVSEKPSSGPAAGILMTVPLERQLEMLTKLAPSVKTIGVVFNPEKSKAFADDLTRAAKARGIEVKTATATTPQDAVKQLSALMPTVGAYIFAPDATIHSPTLEKAAVAASIKHKVPVVGFRGSQCEQGVLFASEMDPIEMGKQAGEVTKMIVADKKTPSPPYAPIKKYKQFVNPKVADQLGLKVPSDVSSAVSLCAEGG